MLTASLQHMTDWRKQAIAEWARTRWPHPHPQRRGASLVRQVLINDNGTLTVTLSCLDDKLLEMAHEGILITEDILVRNDLPDDAVPTGIVRITA